MNIYELTLSKYRIILVILIGLLLFFYGLQYTEVLVFSVYSTKNALIIIPFGLFCSTIGITMSIKTMKMTQMQEKAK